MHTTLLISEHQLLEALDEMSIKLNGLNNWELTQSFNELTHTYSMMLEYIRRGQDDPMNKTLYTQVLQQAYRLNDRIIRQLRLNNPKYELYKNKFTNLSPSVTLNNMLIALENFFEQKTRGFVTDNQRDDALRDHDQHLSNLFTLLWTSGPWSKAESEQAAELLYSDKIEADDKVLVVSAVSLSVIELFDERKIMFLFDAYLSSNTVVCQRALVGLLLALIRHDNRLSDYAEITSRLSLYCENPEFVTNAYEVLTQLQNSLDTEKVNDRMRNEIIPNILKSHRFRRTPIGFEEIDDMLMGQDEKLDWEEKKQRDENDNKLREQLTQMAQMQMDGADVYLNTFSHLKNTPFFSDIAHWFTPFSMEHPAVVHSKLATNTQLPKVLSLFLQSPVLCDSDKYSFCFILETLPDNSQDLMAQQLGMNLDQDEMNQLLEDSKMPKIKPSDLSRAYIHDLFRFFNVFTGYKCPWNPFHDIKCFSPLRFGIFAELLRHTDSLLALGDQMMKKEQYEAARDIYLFLDPKEREDDIDLIQKLAFCCHKLMDPMASHYYEMANRLRPDSVWTLTHYAQMSFAIGSFDTAAQCYDRLLAIDPENVKYIMRKARCHICLEQYAEALPLLFKAAYIDESNLNTIRSISWCLIMQGDYAKAEEYLQKLPEERRNYNDLLNLGHCLYAQERIQEAFSSYRRGHELSQQKGNGHNDFITDFKRDYQALKLQDKGNHTSMPLMLDAICDVPPVD